MAITTTAATIQMRRGNEVDFDPDKMLPGEWSVSLDSKYVRMCFAPGLCIRMATYEGFEEDMKEIQNILKECQDIQTAVQNFVELAETHSEESESWAHGQTGIREGENTDNSKYYSEQAELAKEAAEEARDEAQAATGIVIATTERVGVVKPDGSTITIDPDGTIHASSGADVDIATEEKAGIVKPDGVSTKVKPDGTLSVPGGKPDFYGAYADFPTEGDPDILYIDNTVNPRLMYTWDQESSSYILTGGSEEKEQVYFGAFADFPTTGNSEMLYVDTSNTAVLVMYRWNGIAYVPSGGGAADLDVVAQEFDATKAYTKGTYVIYSGGLYCFTSDKAAGAWDASVVTPTTVGEELSALNAKMEWKLLATKSSPTYTALQIPIPDYLEFAELCVVYESYNAGNYIFNVPKQALTPPKGIRQGFYSSANLTGFASLNVSATTIQMGSYNQNGVTPTNIVMTVYYR